MYTGMWVWSSISLESHIFTRYWYVIHVFDVGLDGNKRSDDSMMGAVKSAATTTWPIAAQLAREKKQPIILWLYSQDKQLWSVLLDFF